MPDHADETGLLLKIGHRLRVGPALSERYLDLHMLAGFEAGDRLSGVQRCRGREDRGFNARALQRFGQVRRDVLDAVLLRHRAGTFEVPADERHDLDAADDLDRIQVLCAKGARAGQDDLHDGRFSRMR